LSLLLAYALAQSVVTADAGNWTVFTNLEKDDCSMTVGIEGGGRLSLHWFPRSKRASVFYTKPAFKSISEDKEYEVELVFLKGKQLDDGWGSVKADGYVSGDEDGSGFLLSLRGDAILDDFATSDTIAFFYKGEVVGSLGLESSAKGIAEIRKCHAAVLKNHPRDPFEE
jgi:hypothetical protein